MDRSEFRAAIAAPSPVVDKNRYIVDRCRGRTVLDVGCIDHSAETALDLGDHWLHAQIRDVARDLVGLDMLEFDARILNDRGFRIELGDAQCFDLGRRFDVIVAGDIIEHLENPGLFLGACRRHLERDGTLIVTTPNPFNIEQFGLGLRRNKFSINEEHVAWYDPRVMFALLTRCGYEVVGFSWVDTRFHFVRQPLVRWLNEQIMRRRPTLRRDFAVVARPAATSVGG